MYFSCRNPCEKPCTKKLKCNHECCGFCGETCPPFCKTCQKDRFFGLKENVEQRFVYLEDCGHIIEHKLLQKFMNDSIEICIKKNSRTIETIKLPECPKADCKKPIRRNFRYSFYIKRVILLIEKIKVKTNSTQNEITDFKIKLTKFVNDNISKIEKENFSRFSTLIRDMNESKTVSELDLSELTNRFILYFKICDIESSSKLNIENESFKQCLNYEIQKIKTLLIHKKLQSMDTFSIQFQKDILNEIKRIYFLSKYFEYKDRIIGPSFYLQRYLNELDDILIKTASIYHDEIQNKVIKLFEHIYPILGVKSAIFNTLDDLVLFSSRQLGFRANNWYYCDRDHLYCFDKSDEKTKKVCPDRLESSK